MYKSLLKQSSVPQVFKPPTSDQAKYVEEVGGFTLSRITNVRLTFKKASTLEVSRT